MNIGYVIFFWNKIMKSEKIEGRERWEGGDG